MPLSERPTSTGQPFADLRWYGLLENDVPPLARTAEENGATTTPHDCVFAPHLEEQTLLTGREHTGHESSHGTSMRIVSIVVPETERHRRDVGARRVIAGPTAPGTRRVTGRGRSPQVVGAQ